MPLYEYACLHCARRFSVLVGMTAQADSDVCPHCGHTQKTRRVSRFAKGRTENDRLDSLADPSALSDDADPRALRQWAKDMGSEMGEDLGDDFDEYLEDADDDADTPGSLADMD